MTHMILYSLDAEYENKRNKYDLIIVMEDAKYLSIFRSSNV